MATHNLPVGVVGQGCHNFQPPLLKLSAVVADVLRNVLPWQEPVEFSSEFQAKRKYRITMGPELLQRKLPLRVPTVALPSSDLSLSKSYEEGQRSVRGVVIFVEVILCPTVIVLLHSTDRQQKHFHMVSNKSKVLFERLFYVKRLSTIH